MIDELKIIKNKFGEKMSRYCRDYLSTVLEDNGILNNFKNYIDKILILRYNKQACYKNI